MKPTEIARRLGRNRSTISREIKRGSVKQVKWVNGKQIYYKRYFLDTAQNRYIKNREGIYYLKLTKVTENFLFAFTEAMKAKPRVHSIDTFVHLYKFKHPKETVPSTKKLYNYIHQGLLAIKPIYLPKMVRIRHKYKTRPATKKHLGISIEQRPKNINDRSTFGHWEIDSVLGLKNTSESSILTLVERQTRFALTVKLPEKKLTMLTKQY